MTYKVEFGRAVTSSESTGQVRIWRSSGQGQGHRIKNVSVSRSWLICLRLNGNLALSLKTTTKLSFV